MSIDFCNDCQIAFDGKNCPLCETQKKIVELEGIIEALETELAEVNK